MLEGALAHEILHEILASTHVGETATASNFTIFTLDSEDLHLYLEHPGTSTMVNPDGSFPRNIYIYIYIYMGFGTS